MSVDHRRSNRQILLNSLNTTPSPDIDKNERGAFYTCAWANSSLVIANTRVLIRLYLSDVTLRPDSTMIGVSRAS